MNTLTPEQVELASRALVSAIKSNLGIEVTTPVIYPNGDCVTVVVEQADGGATVHDASFGSMYLATEGIHFGRSVAARLAPLVVRYGCELKQGRVTKKVTDGDIAIAVALVANASRLIADQAMEIRRQSDNEFRHAVTAILKEIVGERLRENEQIRGSSGRLYRVGNVILDAGQTKPIAFVSSVSSRGTVPNCFSEMYDLSKAFSGVANESVYADHGDLRQEDKAFLSQVSRVIAFSQTATEFARFKKAG